MNGCGGWGKVTGKERCEWCGSHGVEGFQTLNPFPSLPFPGVLEPEAIPEGAELCSQGEPAEHVWLLRVSVEGVGGCERVWESVNLVRGCAVPGSRQSVCGCGRVWGGMREGVKGCGRL